MICRVCLQSAKCALNIFDTNGIQLNIAEIILQHFWFKPIPDDPVSTLICRECWVKVNEFHEFYVKVEQAHENLNEVPLIQDTVKDENSDVLSALLNVEVSIKKEMSDESDINISVLATDNPLYEPEVPDIIAEINENETNEDKISSVTKKKEKRESKAAKKDDKIVDKNGKKLKFDDEEDDEEEEEGKADDDSSNFEEDSVKSEEEEEEEKQVKKKSKKRTRSTVKKVTPNVVKKKKQVRLKWMESRQKDEEMIKKHIPMGCDLCTFVGDTFAEMTQHFREAHPSIRPYVKCCDRKLNKRFLLVQHAYKHEDPNFFWCTECQRSFSDNYVLRSHMLANHAPEEDLAFGCDKCPRRFPRQYLLDLHKPSHIPMEERKFMCDQCPPPKAFASEHLLQIHINMRHTKAINVCHVCAKSIRDNQAFEKHVRLHFEDSGPRVKCPRPNCDRWLKDEDNLKQHLRRHNDEGKIFTCKECGKSCKNRRSLTSHLHYSHSKEVFECEVCQKKFKRAITLKEHMAQHTGQALYKCPFCERTFNSNANMHSHKKKMHPIEWDHWRRTKRGSSQQLLTSENMTRTNPDTLPSSSTNIDYQPLHY